MTFFDLIYFSNPNYLILIAFVIFLYIVKKENKVEQNQLSSFIDAKLLRHLVSDKSGKRLPSWVGIVLVSLLIVGIAGISWEKKVEKKYITPMQTILILDQSLSMYATDIKPNRLTRVKQKVQDLLVSIKEGNIALTAYAGDAFVISPFSQDKSTLKHFLLALDPLIMPLYGSDIQQAFSTSLALISDPAQYTNIILFTDDVNESDFANIKQQLSAYNVKLNIIGVGSNEGANILLPDGNTLRTSAGQVIAKLPVKELNQLARELGANYYSSDLLPSDIEAILSTPISNQDKAVEAKSQSVDWVDKGHWFALPFLIWLLYQFRTGVMLALFVAILPFSPKADAIGLDWFYTQDQKAQKLVDQGDWESAQALFENPKWQAASQYALGNYDAAAEQLNLLNEQQNSASLEYNKGNSLALAGNLDDAIASYKNALKIKPEFTEAQQNLDYLEELKQNQEKQQNENNQQSKDKEQESQDQDQDSQSNSQSDPSKEKDEQNKQEEEQQPENSPDQDNKDTATQEQQEQTPPKQEDDPLTSEEQVALNQWMRQIQDDPGGLLKRKLWYLHQEKRAENRYRQQDGLPIW
ncbi:MAG: VWA domain-containing protein [Marinomonas sp.]